MRFRGEKGSLGRAVIASVLLGELLFALALGLTVGVFSFLNMANSHLEARRQVAHTIAASVMPLVADQRASRIDDSLRSVVGATGLTDIECIRIADSAGATVASYGNSPACVNISEEDMSPWSVFSGSHLVVEPIDVNGLGVARAYVSFAPVPLEEALVTPLLASLAVVVSVMFISVPWTAWLVTKEITEPLHELDGYAALIAQGEYDAEIQTGARGEISKLQLALTSMAGQLKEQRREIEDSYRQLSQAYDSLEQAKQQVEEYAAMKADFVAVAAHEIRNPLSTIRLFSERLEAGEITELDDAGTEAVTAIHSAASRLTSITHDLMDSALLERGLMPLKFADVWLDELVEEAVRDASQAAASTRQVIRVQEQLPEMVIRGDATRMRQVLDNLLSNAMKYSPAHAEINVRVADEEEWVVVDVADQGKGISEADHGRLFSLFGRLDVADNRETTGLGLGLAISARIIEAHGGVLSYRANEEGQGSVFTIRLPKGSFVEPTGYARLDVERRTEEI